jgi:hypothetical protein
LLRRYGKYLLVVSIAGLSGCSLPRPLQDDVTRLPLSDIIRKITCEARDAMHDILDDKGHSQERYGAYKAAKDELKKLTKVVLKPWEDESKELDKKKKALLATKQALETENTAIANIFAKIDEMTGSDREQQLKRVPQLSARRNELRKELVQLNSDIAEYMRAIRKHNASAALSQKRVDAKTKVLQKQFKEFSRYTNHEMAYSFRFKAIETNVASGSASYQLPIHLGSLTWGIGGNDTSKRDGERKASLVITFDDLYNTRCGDAPPEVADIRAVHYPIRGKIGVREVIAQYFAILDRAKQDGEEANGRNGDGSHAEEGEDAAKAKRVFARTEAYVDTISFTTTLTGSLTPSVTLTPASGERLTASLGGSASREDVHTVTISLSAPERDDAGDGKEKITRFQLVNDDF